MERGKRESLSKFFGGAGFYIALLLCVLATGVVGYFALFNGRGPVEDNEQTADTPPIQTPVVNVDDGEGQNPPVPPPAEVTKPVEVLLPEVDVLPPAETVAPVQAEAPQIVVRPLAGEVVTVFSGDELVYNETTADWRTHGGLDISASAGTSVVAASGGTVLSVAEDPRLGVSVTIGHRDGYETTYASLQEEVQVEEGDQVAAGQVIGAVGNTTLTEAGLGAHLHFSVTRDGEVINPEDFLGDA